MSLTQLDEELEEEVPHEEVRRLPSASAATLRAYVENTYPALCDKLIISTQVRRGKEKANALNMGELFCTTYPNGECQVFVFLVASCGPKGALFAVAAKCRNLPSALLHASESHLKLVDCKKPSAFPSCSTAPPRRSLP